MARDQILLCLSTPTVLVTLFQLLTSALSATFTITNNCSYSVWPGIETSSSSTLPTGFALPKGDSKSVHMPTSWSGRVWGRTLCSSDSSGNSSCATGDCGTSAIGCSGSGGTAPATLAEFQLDGTGGMDFYDISVVNGYNLPMLVVPQSSSSGGNCNGTGCSMDLKLVCPTELKVIKSGQIIACKNNCTGQDGDTCRLFKKACPTAFTYSSDDSDSTFTCTGADYVITFCPNATSLKSGQAYKNPPPPPVPPMVFLGGNDNNKSRQDSFAFPSSTAPVILVLVSSWLLTHSLLAA